MKNLVRVLIKSFPPVYRKVNRMRGWRVHDAKHKIAYSAVGGDDSVHNYGAWVVPDNLLDKDSIVYSVGVGDDISFDREVIRRFGSHVFAFDPTPIAVNFLSGQATPPEYHFHQYGLAATDDVVAFDAPGAERDSFSMARPGDPVRGDRIELPVRRLSTLMRELGHAKIDLLKMDIEGFEYDVIDDMLAGHILPTCILLEFHHLQQNAHDRTRRAVAQLEDVGYKLFWVSELGAEYGFVRTPD